MNKKQAMILRMIERNGSLFVHPSLQEHADKLVYLGFIVPSERQDWYELSESMRKDSDEKIKKLCKEGLRASRVAEILDIKYERVRDFFVKNGYFIGPGRRPAKPLAPSVVQEVCLLYKEGSTAIAISEKLKISYNAVLKTLKENGIAIKSNMASKETVSKSMEKEICEAYKAGEYANSIAKRTGVKYPRVLSILKENKLDIKKGGLTLHSPSQSIFDPFLRLAVSGVPDVDVERFYQTNKDIVAAFRNIGLELRYFVDVARLVAPVGGEIKEIFTYSSTNVFPGVMKYDGKQEIISDNDEYHAAIVRILVSPKVRDTIKKMVGGNKA